MSRILVVDDEPNLSASLEALLREEGFQVGVCSSIKEAREAGLSNFQLVVLDWSLPDGAGIDLLRLWRAQGELIPVIMLTARSQLIDKVLGLELGADDYVTKPFEPRELIARIRTRLRGKATGFAPSNSSDSGRPKIMAAGFVMDVERHDLTFQNKRHELTKMEWGLLRLFLENPNRVYSREELLNSVWGMESFPTTRTVDNHVLQLRQKFGPHFFETVRGVGYRFCPEAIEIAET